MKWTNVKWSDLATLRHLGACLVLLALTCDSRAGTDRPLPLAESSAPVAEQLISVPGTSFQFEAGGVRRLLERRQDAGALLGALMVWISENSDLRRVQTVPRIKFSASEEMVALQSAELAGWRVATPRTASHAEEHTVTAVYDSATGTIHLPADWTGETPGQLSILVHEFVHHLQHANAMKFECPQAREAGAYRVQQKWLALFGRDLESEFGVDAFTLLVRTKCFF